jgi:hypothetical protein
MQAYVQTDLGETFLEENFVSWQWIGCRMFLTKILPRNHSQLNGKSPVLKGLLPRSLKRTLNSSEFLHYIEIIGFFVPINLCYPHGMMECWNSGVVRIKSGKAVLLVQKRSPCGVDLPPLHGASLRITSLRHKAKYSCPSASSPPQADAPQTFINVISIHEPIIPVFHYSNIPAGVHQL